MSSMDRAITRAVVRKMQENFTHPPYRLECRLLQCLQRMDESGGRAVLESINRLERARLADTPLRSIKNSLIGTCTIFARAAIEAGASPENCFTLSDVFIQEIEKCGTVLTAQSFEPRMLHEFIRELRESRLYRYGPIVNRAVRFTYDHLQDAATLQQTAAFCGVHPHYLSALFKKETGVSWSRFRDAQKAKAICTMLCETSLCLSQIAASFHFGSASRFSEFFKRHMGASPQQYRKLHGAAE